MENIIIENLFDNLLINLDNDNVIENIIHCIKENLYGETYQLVIDLIIKNLENIDFVLNFLNKLFYYIPSKQIIMLDDIINKINDVDKIKNLFFIDNTDDFIYFNIYFIKNLEYDKLSELTQYIYDIGKINMLINSIKKYIIKIEINNNNLIKLLNIIEIFIDFYNLLNNNMMSDTIINFITNLMNNHLFIYADAIKIIEVIFTNNPSNNQDFINKFKNLNLINKIINFYSNILDNCNNNYKSIFTSIIFYISNTFLFLKVRENQFNIEIFNPLFEKLVNLMYLNNDIINIHDKLIIFIKLSNIFIIYDMINIPSNYVDTLLIFFKSVKFLDWSSFDECIDIFNYISKMLLILDKNHILFNTKCDELLFEILNYEDNILKFVESYINKNINFISYTSIKTILYDLINIINVFSQIESNLINHMNINYCFASYSDVIYKFNIQINKFISLTSNKNINKFNIDLLMRNTIITKFIIFYNQIKLNRFTNYNIEYDEILNYYNKINYVISVDFVENINNIKKIYEDDLILTDKYNDIQNDYFIDKIFCIDIKNPYLLPKYDDFFERDLIRLTIRETNRNPLTREKITLTELDEYNNRDDIKLKLNKFITDKKLFT
jgi:hypothetical protein